MTTYSSSQFDKAVKQVGELPADGPFYGLFKQATVGDNTSPKPGMMDFTGKYKAAWNEQKGVSAEEAKSKYVEHYLALLDKDGSESSMKLKAEVLAA
ncbi:hypothetical protein C6P46_004179 [Rhodotorula mucilaginosa]|uniref:ACB domain-containing protein n=1 Tax=Rhodotorula mucilaginosa TaxID=5537 RepID=A0A9P7B6I3_RHOMI|nr:hypothetical protein C6P46_004179 [Rhodotorula mucilaginosa]TKA51860.1 hypothetical protein B0A53_05212 [Rhodotorula sp. CCFEE 5036]